MSALIYLRGGVLAAAMLAALAAGAQTIDPASFPLQPCKADAVAPCVYVMRSKESASTEDRYREAAKEGLPADRSRNVLGVALSGGGSKASPIAMGVLAGLNDEKLLLPGGSGPADVVIGSVSGGGYSAYHLFTQLWWNERLVNNKEPQQALADAYRDCVNGTDGFAPALKDKLGDVTCKYRFALIDKESRWTNAEQYKVKCTQDILQPGECSPATQSADVATTMGNDALLFVPTLLSLPVHHLANTLFDTGAPLSPSRSAYRTGIGVTYGSVAVSARGIDVPPNAEWRTLLNCPDESGPAEYGAFRTGPLAAHCRVVRTQPNEPGGPTPHSIVYATPVELQFDELAQLRGEGAPRAPFWIIQATGTKYRSIWGWGISNDPDIVEDTFEFTSKGFGSRRYGFVPGHLQGVSVLDAVGSAAAFLDSGQQAITKSTPRFMTGAALHAFNLNWGLDIPNYNVARGWHFFHRMAPFPLYFADSLIRRIGVDDEDHDRLRSVFVRLNDGGNGEDLGLYALIRRNIGTAVVADASGDGHFYFDDLCRLQQQLPERLKLTHGKEPPLYLHLPGFQDFAKNCEDKTGYDFFGEWGHRIPVVLGCVSRSSADTCDTADTVTRLIVIKPRIEWNLKKPNTSGYRNAFERSVDWKAGAVSQCVHDGTLYSAARDKPVDCYATANEAELQVCRMALPCDVAALLENENPDEERKKGYPQSSTVVTTANSSGHYHAASRELARHYTRLAAKVIRDSLQNKGEGEFRTVLEVQRAHEVGLRRAQP